jgi:hypothetical protein
MRPRFKGKTATRVALVLGLAMGLAGFWATAGQIQVTSLEVIWAYVPQH